MFLKGIPSPGPRGLFTTVFVEANDETSACESALLTIKTDAQLLAATDARRSNAAKFLVEEIQETDSFDGCNIPRTSFFLYPADEDMNTTQPEHEG